MSFGGVHSSRINAIRSVFAALVMTATTGNSAYALSCAASSPEESFRSTPIVFMGRVIELVPDPHRTEMLWAYRIQVVERIKGIVDPEVIARLNMWDARPLSSYDLSQLSTAPPRLFAAMRTQAGELAIGGCIGGGIWGAPALIARVRASLADADRAVAERPDDVSVHVDRAEQLGHWGDVERAAPALAEIVQRWPTDARTWLARGRFEYQRGRLAAALADLRRAAEINPGNRELRTLLLQVRLRAGDTSIADQVDLNGLALSQLDLSGIDLRRKDLANLNWERVNLTGADILRGTISRARLRGVNLSNASLIETTAFQIWATEVDLTEAVLAGAAIFESSFTRSTLSRTNLSRINARGTQFGGSLFEDVNFQSAQLAESSFAQTRMRGGNFGNANLDNTDFTSAELSGVDFGNASIRGANFTAARLSAVDISQADVTGAYFFGARFDCRTRFPAGLDPLDLHAIPTDRSCLASNVRIRFEDIDFPSGIDFSNLDLRGASFRASRVDRSSFRGANLTGADFSWSTGGSADFRGADLTNVTFASALELPTFAVAPGESPPTLVGTVFRGVAFTPEHFAGRSRAYLGPDVTRARLQGAVLRCLDILELPPGGERDHQIAWIRALEPRRRGVILGEGCDRVPELADVR